MKIVRTDNFNRENISESLVAENIRSKEIAAFLCQCLREKYSSENSSEWFVTKEDHEPLYIFEP